MGLTSALEYRFEAANKAFGMDRSRDTLNRSCDRAAVVIDMRNAPTGGSLRAHSQLNEDLHVLVCLAVVHGLPIEVRRR